MAIQTLFSFITDETSTTVTELLAAPDPDVFLQNVSNYIGRVKSAITPATVGVIYPASLNTLVAATGTITSTGAATALDTLVVAGVTITAVAATPGALEFIPSATVGTQASRIAAVINTAADFTGLVTAVANAGVVTVTSYIPGVYGNLLTLTESMNNVTVSGSGALAGGTGVISANQRSLLLNSITSYAINR